MKNEFPPQNIEKSFSQIEAEMNTNGFVYTGLEYLTKVKFSNEAKFETVPGKTREAVVDEYIQEYKKQGIDIEIELIDKVGIDRRQQAVYVFIKKK